MRWLSFRQAAGSDALALQPKDHRESIQRPLSVKYVVSCPLSHRLPVEYQQIPLQWAVAKKKKGWNLECAGMLFPFPIDRQTAQYRLLQAPLATAPGSLYRPSPKLASPLLPLNWSLIRTRYPVPYAG